MVNGGYFNSPTFFKRSRAEAKIYAKRVLKAETSLKMRYLMRLNVQQGTAKRSAVPGYRVGGKTGTAEKWVSGRYDSNRNRNTFIAAFPIDDPRYIVVALLDEPKGIAETHGFSASGFNVAPTVAGIINRIAPMLGVVPDQGLEDDDAEVLLAATN
jgi:cell division protein FtsI (penicillin-binding protein 3)